jgi:hypothetical protein
MLTLFLHFSALFKKSAVVPKRNQSQPERLPRRSPRVDAAA